MIGRMKKGCRILLLISIFVTCTALFSACTGKEDTSSISSSERNRPPSEWSNIKKLSGFGPYLVGLRTDGLIMSAKMDVYSDEPESSREESKRIIDKLSSWNNIVDLCWAYNGFFALKSDGTVVTTTNANVSSWKGIQKIVCGGWGWAAGLQGDGRVVTTKKAEYSSLDSHWQNSWLDTSEWTNIRDIYPITGISGRNGLIGITSQRTVVCTLPEDDAYYRNPYMGSWTDITAICCDLEGVYGLKADGTVLVPPYLSSLLNDSFWGTDPTGWQNISTLYQGYDGAMFGVRTDGTVSSMLFEFDYPKEMYNEINGWTNIKMLYSGYRSVWGITKDGRVLCADYSFDQFYNTEKLAQWENISELFFGGVSGNPFIAGLRTNGSVVVSR